MKLLKLVILVACVVASVPVGACDAPSGYVADAYVSTGSDGWVAPRCP